jgi:hypothetical protein
MTTHIGIFEDPRGKLIGKPLTTEEAVKLTTDKLNGHSPEQGLLKVEGVQDKFVVVYPLGGHISTLLSLTNILVGGAIVDLVVSVHTKEYERMLALLEDEKAKAA